MNFKIWMEEHEERKVIGYHATRAIFDSFDLNFATDAIGMRINEGLGHNKFYFSKDKKHSYPQVGKNPAILITAELTFSNPISGNEYRERLTKYFKLARKNAIDQIDKEIKTEGYDSIDDGWQIAVFYPKQIKILSKEKFNIQNESWFNDIAGKEIFNKQTFSFDGSKEYNVPILYRYAKRFGRLIDLPIDLLIPEFKNGTSDEPDDSEDFIARSEKSDLKVPIIVLNKDGKYFIIDGRHRVAKAIRNSMKTIKAWIINDLPKF